MGAVPVAAALDRNQSGRVSAMDTIRNALKLAEHALRLDNRYAKEFGLPGMEQDTKKALAAVRAGLRALKALGAQE